MIIVCIILSGLALLAAVANIILFCVEKKRREHWEKTMTNYVTAEASAATKAAEIFTKEHVAAMAEQADLKNTAFYESLSKHIDDTFEIYRKDMAMIARDVEGLKNGIMPDYEMAMEAAKAVNNFNAGIANIMNFDPIDVARKQRQGNEKAVG